MNRKLAIVTGGGDCPGQNAVIRAVVKTAARRGWDSVGVLGGFEGLLDPPRTRLLDWREMGSLLYRGGTVLGGANRGRFAAKTGHGETRRIAPEVVAEAQRNLAALGAEALVAIGGDGTLAIAEQLARAGVPAVAIPKTIDNDVEGTAQTFGFDSAVACATEALDRLHSTAESHDRVMVLEVMGRWAGWIAAVAGVAGGADVILVPEIEFDWESVCDAVAARERIGKRFTMIVCAEGARVPGGGFAEKGGSSAEREARLGGIGEIVAKEVERRTGKESRVCVLGHLQRGGTPTAFDRHLCTRFGVAAVELVAEGRFGQMTSFAPPEIVAVPLADVVGRIRKVPVDGQLVRAARAVGTSFGDERRRAAAR
jgi:ATP-dependent phosphofructokinase / diphosphate-dependent phosphofructokinase